MPDVPARVAQRRHLLGPQHAAHLGLLRPLLPEHAVDLAPLRPPSLELAVDLALVEHAAGLQQPVGQAARQALEVAAGQSLLQPPQGRQPTIQFRGQEGVQPALGPLADGRRAQLAQQPGPGRQQVAAAAKKPPGPRTC